MIDRQKLILEQLTDEKKLEVAALAERIGVSPVTMRKDLDALEKMGLIVREHGYAYIGSRDNLNSRLAYHYEDKRRIAKLAAESVETGETIMIESGSCCALLAAELAAAKRNVSVVTNSAFIADYVRGQSRMKVILLGGEYQSEAQVMVGPLTCLCCDSFRVDKLFIGTDGFSPGFGFTGDDMMRVDTVKCMRRRASKLFVLTESSKFRRQGVVSLMPFSDITGVYTDALIPEGAEALLTEKGVQVYKA